MQLQEPMLLNKTDYCPLIIYHGLLKFNLPMLFSVLVYKNIIFKVIFIVAIACAAAKQIAK
jgi:hypothetical protein